MTPGSRPPRRIARSRRATGRGLAGRPSPIRIPIREARRLYAEEAVSVLPGSYISRDAAGRNPGRGYIRIALVAEFRECKEAIDRLVRFVNARC